MIIEYNDKYFNPKEVSHFSTSEDDLNVSRRNYYSLYIHMRNGDKLKIYDESTSESNYEAIKKIKETIRIHQRSIAIIINKESNPLIDSK